MRIVIGVALLAACGGSDTTMASTTTGPTTTASAFKADFLKKANAICKTLSDQADQLTPPASSPDVDPRGYGDFLMKSVVIASAAIDKLRALPKPPGDEPTLEALYKTMTDSISKLKETANTYKAGDKTTAAKLRGEWASATVAVKTTLRAYGLTECFTG